MPDEPKRPLASGERRRWIVSLARENAYVPMARPILSRLGYTIVPLDDWVEDPKLLAHRPELALVDERRIDDLPQDADFARLPLVLLTGRGGVRSSDPRVIGGIPMPAGLHELYRVLQQALEEKPRSCLRVPTSITVRISQKDHAWEASLRSLSENGCLVRSDEPLAMDTPLRISFDLPRLGRVETDAEPTYQLLPDTGLVFQRTTPGHRRSIQIFVEKNVL